MKKLLLVLALLTSTTVSAAFLSHSYVSGMNKVCVYNDLGSTVAITVASYEMCPLVI